MISNHINLLAIFVSSVIVFLLGALWYSPLLFGKIWIKRIGKSEEEIKRNSGASSYVFTFILWIIVIYVLATVMNITGAISVSGGIYISVLCWIGFTGATSLIHHTFAGRSNSIWLIDSGYTLLSFIISGFILSVWL